MYIKGLWIEFDTSDSQSTTDGMRDFNMEGDDESHKNMSVILLKQLGNAESNLAYSRLT